MLVGTWPAAASEPLSNTNVKGPSEGQGDRHLREGERTLRHVRAGLGPSVWDAFMFDDKRCAPENGAAA